MRKIELQDASKKEVRRMAVGSIVCGVFEVCAFWTLHLLGIVRFDYRIVLSVTGGVAVSLLGFVMLCLSVQRAVGMEPGKAMKERMQMSYNLRLLLQAGWVIVAFAAPCFNVLAAAAPLLFPSVIIFFLLRQGKLVEPSERKNPEHLEEEEIEERLEIFEA